MYLRIEGEGEARVEFVAAKSRVAPSKKTTIPRLELLSALLLAKLCHSAQEALQDTIHLGRTVCFTDSQVALHWITNMDQEWKQFVQNRATTIRQLVPSSQWRHCPGEVNPADIPSRGMNPKELKKTDMWLKGPDWLRHNLDPASEKK